MEQIANLSSKATVLKRKFANMCIVLKPNSEGCVWQSPYLDLFVRKELVKLIRVYHVYSCLTCMHLFESLQRRQTWHVDILLYGTVCDSEWVVCFKGRKTKEERQHKAGAIREGAADLEIWHQRQLGLDWSVSLLDTATASEALVT